MWIKEVKIKNFKNYKGELVFDLDKKITILYGDNGFGKSSFFDALEWGLTGSISRFEYNDSDSSFSDDELLNDEMRKFENVECSVTICFGMYNLKRYFTANNGVKGNTQVDFITTESDKRGSTLVHKDHGKANVDRSLRRVIMPTIGDSSLDLKQPYILSQDQVTDFVLKDKPKQRYKSLANLVGLTNIINYSDNLRQIIRELNTRLNNYEKIEIKNQAIIDTYTPKEAASFPIIMANAREMIDIGDDIDQSQLQDLINKARQNNNSEMTKLNQQIDVLNKLNEFEERSIPDLRRSLTGLNEKLTKFEDHSQYTKNNIARLNEKLLKFETDAENKIKLEALIAQRGEIDSNIQAKEDDYKNINIQSGITLVNVGDYINTITNEIEKTNYTISFRDAFISYNEELNTIPVMTDECSVLIESLERKKKRKEIWLEKLSALSDNKIEKKSEIKLAEFLQNIYDYLVQIQEFNNCPVCSSDKNGQLLVIAKKNLDNRSETLKDQAKKMKRIFSIKDKLNDIIITLNREIQEQKYLQEDYSRKQDRAFEQIETIKMHSSFEKDLFLNDKEILLNKVKSLEETLKRFNQAKLIFVELKELERKRLNISSQIIEMRSFITNDSSGIIEILKRKVVKRENYNNKILNMIKQFKQNKETILLHQELLNSYEILEINSFNEIINDKTLRKESIQKRLRELDSLFQTLSDHLSAIKIKSNVDSANIELQETRKKMKYINECISEINEYIDSINKKIGNEALSFLNQNNSSVQQYYRYLNPMINSKKLKFVAQDEELSIKVTDNVDSESSFDSNAKFVLSSGQMNVLALSIFLSINEAMDTELDFVAIDDPIQNMDDINQFSVCDILSNIKRQLIFSTHDIDFVKLFVKKNEHLDNSMQVFMLKKPTINEQDGVEKVLFV